MRVAADERDQLELGQPLQQRAGEFDPLADRHHHVGVFEPVDELVEVARRLAIARHVVVADQREAGKLIDHVLVVVGDDDFHYELRFLRIVRHSLIFASLIRFPVRVNSAFMIRPELLGRGRGDDEAELGETLADGRVVQRGMRRGVELGDDLRRRLGRHQERAPGGEGEARHRLGQESACRGTAAGAAPWSPPSGARACRQERRHRRHRREHDRHLAADDVLHRGRDAAIGTCVIWMPAARMNSSMPMCCGLPGPPEA